MLETKLIPAANRDSKRLMVILHGLGDSMAGYSWMPGQMQWPWMNYLFVNAPDPYYGGFSWYDYPGDAAPGVRRSIGLLTALLDAQKQAGFPTAETVLFGFSQGCLMTLETGLRYSNRLAALVGVSGYVLDPQVLLREAAPSAKSQRVLVSHGRLDPLIPCFEAQAQMDQLRAGGIPIEWHEYDKVHTIIEPELDVIRAFIEASFRGT